MLFTKYEIRCMMSVIKLYDDIQNVGHIAGQNLMKEEQKMRIALINENSQAAKNELIYKSLKKVADAKGYEVDNYGMYSAEDACSLTYVQNGILAVSYTHLTLPTTPYV